MAHTRAVVSAAKDPADNPMLLLSPAVVLGGVRLALDASDFAAALAGRRSSSSVGEGIMLEVLRLADDALFIAAPCEPPSLSSSSPSSCAPVSGASATVRKNGGLESSVAVLCKELRSLLLLRQGSAAGSSVEDEEGKEVENKQIDAPEIRDVILESLRSLVEQLEKAFLHA
eukprot:CAMPEP_0185266854 /NCGR_PEP_ID=MMETSP1359-20130426/32536_1 /TAXON_ID=552665 /ORGANISM="Bigelowiella longifila, Strain CCMP242" /LENGTH=171 /DNA_ID=CAMNT_0027856901 /DNA_START=142 /DNA_END=657 /DNA_ORIENTATION=-